MVNIGDHFNLAKLSGWCLEDPPPQCSPVCLVAKGCRTLHFPLWLSGLSGRWQGVRQCEAEPLTFPADLLLWPARCRSGSAIVWSICWSVLVLALCKLLATSAVSLRPCSYIQYKNQTSLSKPSGIHVHLDYLVSFGITNYLWHQTWHWGTRVWEARGPKGSSLALTCYGVLSWTICCKTSATWFQPELWEHRVFPWACFGCCNNCPQCSTWHDHWSNAFARSIKTWPESVRWKTNVTGTKTPEKNNSLSFQQPCIAAAIKKCEAMHSQRLYLQWSWKMERNVSPTRPLDPDGMIDGCRIKVVAVYISGHWQ